MQSMLQSAIFYIFIKLMSLFDIKRILLSLEIVTFIYKFEFLDAVLPNKLLYLLFIVWLLADAFYSLHLCSYHFIILLIDVVWLFLCQKDRVRVVFSTFCKYMLFNWSLLIAREEREAFI
jgi:hypothetical protein